MWDKFFSGEVAVYASTKVEAARFIKAYMDTGVENLSDEHQAFAAQDDIEFAYNFFDNFFDNQISWADGEYDGPNQGWHEKRLDWRADAGFVSNPGAPYTSITVKEFFGDE